MRNHSISYFSRRAFTLVELIIVIVIVGILAAISIVGYQSVVDRTEEQAVKASLASVEREYRALAAFGIANGGEVDVADMTAFDELTFDTDASGTGTPTLNAGDTATWTEYGISITVTFGGYSTPGSVGGSTPAFSVAYSQQAFDISASSQVLSPTASGAAGPVAYSITSGTLPTGVSFNSSTGTFTGAPAWNPSATAVDLGAWHTCVLLSDATVDCWGWDGDGESSGPSSASNVTAVATGDYHTCAVISDGTVQCWGDNSDGQTAVPPSVSGATAVTAGALHTCALHSGGTVTCWGSNSSPWTSLFFGQSTVPASVSNAIAVSAGSYHTCALLSGGTVECWGWFNDGDYGYTIPSVSNATAVTADTLHTCAAFSDGTVECWGNNYDGQSTVPAGIGNAGFPATIEIEANDGTNTATPTVELTLS